MTITREWIEKTIAEFENTRDDIPFGLDDDDAKILKVLKQVLKQVLASMDAEPVAWTDEQELRDVKRDGFGYLFTVNPITPHADPRRVIKLFAVPPVPGVYDDVLNIIDLLENNEWAEHCTNTVLGSLLESEITRLVGMTQPAPSESASQPLTDALRDVIAERQRQISVKGWTPEHDDTYIGCELAAAAISYIEPVEAENYWPADWHDGSFRPSDYRRNLVKATALLVTELERLDRISATSVLSEVPDGEARKD
ncbi:hypothetical protein YI12_09330 [Salmonella enterica]|nr:hypothetical protein [Salmonella enterica]EAU0060475.1 hypothetical protein [Salmonella enterica]EAU0087064.1 hypothetical protein [Salmonella enterica]EAX0958880.1 hypothetical protein [Salmonella enterica]EBP5445031.1 hypothetical protein [Salmonella enterica]